MKVNMIIGSKNTFFNNVSDYADILEPVKYKKPQFRFKWYLL